jgi:hypothetical protein
MGTIAGGVDLCYCCTEGKPTDKGKLAERRGRKAKGLKHSRAMIAQLPKWNGCTPSLSIPSCGGMERFFVSLNGAWITQL